MTKNSIAANATISSNIKKFREKSGLTQKELGNKIHKSEISIRKYESGNTNIPKSTFLDIAAALSVNPIDFFVDNSGNMLLKLIDLYPDILSIGDALNNNKGIACDILNTFSVDKFIIENRESELAKIQKKIIKGFAINDSELKSLTDSTKDMMFKECVKDILKVYYLPFNLELLSAVDIDNICAKIKDLLDFEAYKAKKLDNASKEIK